MNNELLKERINNKLYQLKDLKDIYLLYLLNNDNDKFAREQLNIINEQIRLLKEILEGE